jgi:subtilisin family serine protease
MFLMETILKIQAMRSNLLLVIATLLAACDGSGSGLDKPSACGTATSARTMSVSAREIPIHPCDDDDYSCNDAYPCDVDTSTGETEPLYAFQWALNYKNSYFNGFPDTFGSGMDLNVEPVHRQGFKGQGVNMLVLDGGFDELHEDLLPNFKTALSWSFTTKTHSPQPKPDDAHGTNVAGIIAAAQNGLGVMGIAPRVNLGGADSLHAPPSHLLASYGGAPWSSQGDVFNVSYGLDTLAYSYESDIGRDRTAAARGLKKLRNGKGAIFIKSAGNSFHYGFNPKKCESGGFSCVNPANDTLTLEPNILTIAGLNAQGSASQYSSAGSVIWVTGMAGEYGNQGDYGERSDYGKDGPTIFTTDLKDCVHGPSNARANTSFLRGQTERDGKPDNPNCDYAYINGTSASAPTIAGVAALVLSANPELTWRDVRDILRLSARKVDENYELAVRRSSQPPSSTLMDLRTNQPLNTLGKPADIVDGATAFPPELGWQRNAAGNDYSNWYGFGVPDAEKAVALALEYKKDPGKSRSGNVQIPDFRSMAFWHLNFPNETHPSVRVLDEAQIRSGPFPYQQVTSMGKFKWDAAQTVDQFQVRLSGANVCLGSLGFAVRSPSGTTSLLKLPNDHFRKNGIHQFSRYGLGSYAFYGEPAQGDWEIFAIAANPDLQFTDDQLPCHSKNGNAERNFTLLVQARIIAQ